MERRLEARLKMPSLPPAEIRPNRQITGMSAVLLPFDASHQPDWDAFDRHVRRTLDVGLVPAVNMDTGYINLLDDQTRLEVLQRTSRICDGRMFVAGAYVADQPGDPFPRDRYAARIEEIQNDGGTPVFFQCYGLTEQTEPQIVESYQQLSALCDRWIGFELGTVFLPFGRIYSLEVYHELMKMDRCVGAKHSSLQRDLEWQRLALRDQHRPDFMVLTGNDLAVDMVMYGSDYLLGLSSFCPDLFALRDRMWAEGDASFYQLNDILQYLGFFAFRQPVPAYKHTCAQFLHLRAMIETNLTHPDAVVRPESDIPILEDILRMLQDYLPASG